MGGFEEIVFVVVMDGDGSAGENAGRNAGRRGEQLLLTALATPVAPTGKVAGVAALPAFGC